MLCPSCRKQTPLYKKTCVHCGYDLSKISVDDLLDVTNLTSLERELDSVSSERGLLIGDRVDDRYQVKALVGRGSFGAVYRGQDLHSGDTVAIKVLHEKFFRHGAETLRDRLEETITKARGVNHPNLIQILDFIEERGLIIIVFEHMVALPLAKLIKVHTDKASHFDLEHVVDIFQQIYRGLSYAHSSLYHGNLTPDNIMIRKELVKITDFGIAAGLFPGIPTPISRTFKGEAYRAPEILEAPESLTFSADIYSAGAILFHMLNLTPFTRLAEYTEEFEKRYPPSLKQIIAMATAAKPAERYQDMEAFYNSLVNAAGTASVEEPEVTTPVEAPEFEVVEKSPSQEEEDIEPVDVFGEDASSQEPAVHFGSIDGSEGEKAEETIESVFEEDSLPAMEEENGDDGLVDSGESEDYGALSSEPEAEEEEDDFSPDSDFIVEPVAEATSPIKPETEPTFTPEDNGDIQPEEEAVPEPEPEPELEAETEAESLVPEEPEEEPALVDEPVAWQGDTITVEEEADEIELEQPDEPEPSFADEPEPVFMAEEPEEVVSEFMADQEPEPPTTESPFLPAGEKPAASIPEKKSGSSFGLIAAVLIVAMAAAAAVGYFSFWKPKTEAVIPAPVEIATPAPEITEPVLEPAPAPVSEDPEKPEAVTPPAPVPEVKPEPPAPLPEPVEPPASPVQDNQEKVRALLRQGDQFFAQENLTTPPGKNALQRYRAALALDAGNAGAKNGIRKIEGQYVTWGDSNMEDGNLNKASQYYSKALQVNPDSRGARNGMEAVKKERERRLAEATAAPPAFVPTPEPPAPASPPEPAPPVTPAPPVEKPVPEPPANLEEKVASSGEDELVSLDNLSAELTKPTTPVVEDKPKPPVEKRKGSIPIDEVKKVIRSYMGRIKICYREGLKENPGLKGEIKVQFTIGMGGNVTATKIASSTLNNATVENCILRRFSRMQFPEPEGGDVTIKYPLIFKE